MDNHYSDQSQGMEIDQDVPMQDINEVEQPSSEYLLRRGRGFDGKPSVSEIKEDTAIYETYEEGEAYTDLVQKSVEGYVIFFTNIHEEATEEDMQDVFSEYGTVSNLHLNLDRRSGYVKGYVLIEYRTFEEAKAAVLGLNGRTVLNRPIKGDFAFARSSVKGLTRVF